MIDGAPVVVERGVAGDHRFVHGAPPDQHGAPSNGTRAVHHLSPDASVLQCAPSDPADPSWWRVVLDSVLFTVALLQGYEALHAGAIATPDGVIAITAASGGGKSTMLTELLGRGLALMTDDVLALESRTDAPPLAHPGAPLMTVPANTTPAPGTLISSIGEERWTAVPVHPEPLPLKTLVVLDRQPGLQTTLRSNGNASDTVVSDEQLAREINTEHGHVETHKRTTTQHAIRCGELLLEMKRRVGHGNWLAWVDEHFQASERTARNYMEIAKSAAAADLNDDTTMRSALRALASRSQSQETTSEPTNGSSWSSSPRRSRDDRAAHRHRVAPPMIYQ